jgi:hypothetical protein
MLRSLRHLPGRHAVGAYRAPSIAKEVVADHQG